MTEKNNTLRCFIDGNCICITKDDFVDIQESDVVFVELDRSQIRKIKELVGWDGKLPIKDGHFDDVIDKSFEDTLKRSNTIQELKSNLTYNNDK